MAEDELKELTPEEIEALRTIFAKEVSVGPPEELKLMVHTELEQLLYNNADIQTTLLVDSAGFPVDFISKQETKLQGEDSLIIASANFWGLFATAERESLGINLGHVKMIITRTQNGFIFITKCGENFALVAIVKPQAKLGVIMRELEATAKRIAEKLSGFTI
ncbi:MAG: roadblock/LC7 domain-containing protein [Crenarchaeota archaeon]|nr:roadblock/LC7 domain-containing protein [Thermoproteota archaeon]